MNRLSGMTSRTYMPICPVAGALALLAMAGVGAAEPPTTVARVDLERYMGRWYEIAAIPNFFQRNCALDTTAEYSLRADGLVAIANRCTDKRGENDEAQGVARVADPPANAKLEVSFVSFFGARLFWGDYWVLDLGADYEYALIGTPSRRWGWILARDPRPAEDRVREWLARLRDKGYDPNEFVLTRQTGSAPP